MANRFFFQDFLGLRSLLSILTGCSLAKSQTNVKEKKGMETTATQFKKVDIWVVKNFIMIMNPYLHCVQYLSE
jgi:hypothetical protein